MSLPMLTEEDHLESLSRHIQRVYDNCRVISDGLIKNNEFHLAKNLLRNGCEHDISKFDGIEWDHLVDRSDPLFKEALLHHYSVNKHHPEYWGSIHEMDDVYIAEMVCDWESRCSEYGQCFYCWLDKAHIRWGFSTKSRIYDLIIYYSDFLPHSLCSNTCKQERVYCSGLI